MYKTSRFFVASRRKKHVRVYETFIPLRNNYPCFPLQKSRCSLRAFFHFQQLYFLVSSRLPITVCLPFLIPSPCSASFELQRLKPSRMQHLRVQRVNDKPTAVEKFSANMGHCTIEHYANLKLFVFIQSSSRNRFFATFFSNIPQSYSF